MMVDGAFDWAAGRVENFSAGAGKHRDIAFFKIDDTRRERLHGDGVGADEHFPVANTQNEGAAVASGDQ